MSESTNKVVEMEIAQNGRRKAGRPKGARNKPQPDADAYIRKIEKACGRTLEDLLAKALLNHRTTALVALRLLEYKIGKPQEHLNVTGGVAVYDVIAAARARVASLQPNSLQPSPPYLKPAEIDTDSGGWSSNTEAEILEPGK